MYKKNIENQFDFDLYEEPFNHIIINFIYQHVCIDTRNDEET